MTEITQEYRQDKQGQYESDKSKKDKIQFENFGKVRKEAREGVKNGK